MSTAEEVRFDVLSNKFNTAIDAFAYHSEDERSWALLDSRGFEIMDSLVNNTKKAQALDRLLNEISRIHPHADTAYCQALEKRLAVTDKKNKTELERIAKDAYFHRRNANIMLYGKIIYDIYHLSENKNDFPYKDIAKTYRRKYLAQGNAKERALREDDLRRIDFDLNDPSFDPAQKLNRVEDALELVQEKYFGPIEANKIKNGYCKDAVRICHEELHDTKTADKYSAQAFDFKRRAANAERKWAQRRGLWTNAQEQAFLQEFRSDKGR